MPKKLIYLFSFVLVLGMGFSLAHGQAGLVVYWKLDESSGTTAADNAGGDNDGTLTGDQLEWRPSEGRYGGALWYGGLATSYVAFPTTGMSAAAGTLALWGNLAEPQPSQTRYIFGHTTIPAFSSRIQLYMDGGNTELDLGIGDSHTSLTGIMTLETETWYHIALTWEGGNYVVYIDGEEVATGTYIDLTTLNTEADIGNDGNRDGRDEGFGGLIDEVRLYDRALTEAEIQRAMKGIFFGSASNPSPANEATDVPREVVLSWEPGEFAAPTNGHKVYFGESFDDVNDATGGVAQTVASYTPAQRPDFNTTYYWRVDEVNAPPTSHVEFKGEVWSFTTEPIGYAIENVTATASSALPNMGPENTVNGSGMDADDLHSTEQTDMWLSGDEPNGAWIEFELDKVYKLHEMFVWNSNQAIEYIVGFSAKGVTVEYSVDGNDYTTLGTTGEFARAPGTPGYAHNTTVDFGGAAAKNIRLTITSNWGSLPQYSLSEVGFTYIPVLAREPQPQSGTTDMDVDVTLGFRAGRDAATHNIYISTDEQAVMDSTADVASVTEASHGPLPLDLGQTYYWKVNEVNDAETPTMWEGDVWNFRTQEYFVVENFEDYNDYPGNRIYETWADGWEIPTNGALLGYPEPIDFAAGDHILETTDIRGGEQSLPFFYDNNTAASSEASVNIAELPIGSDWTGNGVKTLSLWFKGITGAFLEAPAGTFTMTASGADIWGTADEFRYAFKQLSGDGSIVAKVESVENTDVWAKAGVMIRNKLYPDSINAMAYITPDGRVGWQYRVSVANGSSSTRTEPGAITTPHWVKLTRQGNTITAMHSSDGVNWEDIVEVANPDEPTFMDILMNQNVYIGLALTSHNVSAVCTAKFSNVQTTGAVSPQTWSQQAIGADMPTVAANAADQMYVALSNSGGLPAAVYHNDPSATQVGGWTKWDIELQKFADKGIDLSNVDKFYIGVGDKNNLQAGGSGMMLFDDVYLYPIPEPEPTP